MEVRRTESQRLREQLSGAMDLKEAASMKDPFASHIMAPEKEEVLEVETQLDQAFSDEHPSHERVEKLLALKDSFKTAHVELAPEEGEWRREVDAAMK